MTSDYNLCKRYLRAPIVFPVGLRCPRPRFLHRPHTRVNFKEIHHATTASALPPTTGGPGEDSDTDYSGSQAINNAFQSLLKSHLLSSPTDLTMHLRPPHPCRIPLLCYFSLSSVVLFYLLTYFSHTLKKVVVKRT